MDQEGKGGLSEISRDECFELLAGHPVGRVAMAVEGDGPLVVPVNFILDGEAIVFRSDPGMKVRLLRQGPAVSFQVDQVDWYHHTGWSVLARGVAYEATHWEVEHLALEPWAEGDKGHWVRIVVRDVTGRRLERGELSWPGDDRGYL
jgi:nitroimidazol reductase NimA-like FMN-containing flavoprotein (pyridoxamine 5'-phosphate oxidase superfamily)